MKRIYSILTITAENAHHVHQCKGRLDALNSQTLDKFPLVQWLLCDVGYCRAVPVNFVVYFSKPSASPRPISKSPRHSYQAI